MTGLRSCPFTCIDMLEAISERPREVTIMVQISPMFKSLVSHSVDTTAKKVE